MCAADIFIFGAEGIFELSEGSVLASLGLKPGQVVGESAPEPCEDFPGEHSVTVTRGDEPLAERRVVIRRGDTLDLDIAMPSAVPLDRPRSPQPTPAPPPSDDAWAHVALVVTASLVATCAAVFSGMALGVPEALGIAQPHLGSITPGTIALP